MENTKLLMDEIFQAKKIDADFAIAILRFKSQFENKNDNHIQYFGSALTGCYPIFFSQSDRMKWFTDVLDIDEHDVQRRIYEIPSRTGLLFNRNWKVAPEVFNITALYLMHRFMVAQMPEAAHSVCILMNYRFITSLNGRYFRSPVDEEIAAAAYSNMSLRFDLKRYGSWRETIIQRAHNILEPRSIHHDLIMAMGPDHRIAQALNDMQGRVRSYYKQIYRQILKTSTANQRIQKTTMHTVTLDGQAGLRDQTKSLTQYTRYLHTVVPNRDQLIKPELLTLVSDAMRGLDEKHLRLALTWMCETYLTDHQKIARDLVDQTMIHAFRYLSEYPRALDKSDDLLAFLVRLRGAYMSSRSSDRDLKILRETAQLVVIATGSTRDRETIQAAKTGLLLYLVLRALTRSYYS